MSKAKWFAVRKPSTGEIIVHQPIRLTSQNSTWTYINVVLHSTDPPSSCSVEGGSGDENITDHAHLHVSKACNNDILF